MLVQVSKTACDSATPPDQSRPQGKDGKIQHASHEGQVSPGRASGDQGLAGVCTAVGNNPSATNELSLSKPTVSIHVEHCVGLPIAERV